MSTNTSSPADAMWDFADFFRGRAAEIEDDSELMHQINTLPSDIQNAITLVGYSVGAIVLEVVADAFRMLETDND